MKSHFHKTDTTLLYYTANRIPEQFAKNVRDHLWELSNGMPIISVSQKPIDFGENIHAEGLLPCSYNVYAQILMGAEKAKTKYVVCCEDDSLYTIDHLNFEPPLDLFYYNRNVWHLSPRGFFHNRRLVMSMCVVKTSLMIDSLRARFDKYPSSDAENVSKWWGEPGWGEEELGLPRVGWSPFKTRIPSVTIHHRDSLFGDKRAYRNLRQELPFWGKAENVRGKFYVD